MPLRRGLLSHWTFFSYYVFEPKTYSHVILFIAVSRRELPWTNPELAPYQRDLNSLKYVVDFDLDLKCNLKSRGYRVIAAPVI